ncbi:MAG: lipase family protein, partial [Candidatus Wenzhouxiangella sp. M2_3B_020]
IARGCAPSLLKNTFSFVPGWPDVLEQGWIWVATDYAGLGTAGPHPYLVGPAEGYAVLDAVRATRAIDGLEASTRTVAWGHSQGGHAALWTGIVAPAYAPDVDLVGVAAVAPASDLVALVEAVHDSLLGRMLSALLVHGYSAVYPDVRLGDLLRPVARPLARDLADRCMAGIELAVSAVPALLAAPTLFRDDPPTGAFRQRLAENTPDRAIDAPVLIAQGGEDPTVRPGIQAGFVARRCMAGQQIDYRGFPAENHLSIVGSDSPVPELLVGWSRDRFAGRPVAGGCTVWSDEAGASPVLE